MIWVAVLALVVACVSLGVSIAVGQHLRDGHDHYPLAGPALPDEPVVIWHKDEPPPAEPPRTRTPTVGLE